MIRRNDGNDWLLISQIEHARLAAEIAEFWNGEAVTALPFRDELLPAIRHHDDGWEEWEQSPAIDPETGKPRDFMEMPTPVAVEIWTRSIERCQAMTPQAGLWVSGHFCYLAERALEHRVKESNTEESAVLQRFLDLQSELQSGCLLDLAESMTAEQIESGFRHIQFFDRISLWICGAAREKRVQLTTPFGESIELTPIDAKTIVVTPPALSADVELVVPVCRIPSRRYADDRDLQSTIADANTERLTWIIRNDG